MEIRLLYSGINQKSSFWCMQIFTPSPSIRFRGKLKFFKCKLTSFYKDLNKGRRMAKTRALYDDPKKSNSSSKFEIFNNEKQRFCILKRLNIGN
jgi:hypothetical protein